MIVRVLKVAKMYFSSFLATLFQASGLCEVNKRFFVEQGDTCGEVKQGKDVEGDENSDHDNHDNHDECKHDLDGQPLSCQQDQSNI